MVVGHSSPPLRDRLLFPYFPFMTDYSSFVCCQRRSSCPRWDPLLFMKSSNVIGKQPESNFNWWWPVIVGKPVNTTRGGRRFGAHYFLSTFFLRALLSWLLVLRASTVAGRPKNPENRIRRILICSSPFRRKETSRAAPSNQTDFHVFDRWIPLNQFSPVPSKLKVYIYI